MRPWLDDGDVRLYHGDCLDVLRELEAGSIDAVITDPPYGISFMGTAWDTFDPATMPARVGVRNGNGPPADSRDGRTKGRTRSAFANPAGEAGAYDFSPRGNHAFQRWCEAWASECLRVLKPGGHLLSFGGTRTYHRLTSGIEDAGFEIRDSLMWLYGSGFPKSLNVAAKISPAIDEDGATDPALDALAEPWRGWGTALKPGHEPVAVARKPITGTVAANVLAHGTGALNIDACRVAVAEGDYAHEGNENRAEVTPGYRYPDAGRQVPPHDAGRWPPNVILDEAAAGALDEHTGELVSGANPERRGSDKFRNAYGDFEGQKECVAHRGRDVGGASRFYYCAKASNADRGHENDHPTVKPVELMRWLVRLVTPPGGVVLDPFAGSGTTGVACRAEHVRCVLIEREAKYLPIIAGRLSQLSLLSHSTEGAPGA